MMRLYKYDCSFTDTHKTLCHHPLYPVTFNPPSNWVSLTSPHPQPKLTRQFRSKIKELSVKINQLKQYFELLSSPLGDKLPRFLYTCGCLFSLIVH